MERHTILESVAIPEWSARRAIYEKPVAYRDVPSENDRVRVGDWLIDTGMTAFLEASVTIPEAWYGKTTGLVVRPGAKGFATMHEALLRLDGLPYHGLDRNRSYVPLPKSDAEKHRYELKIELYNPIAQVQDALNRQNEPAEYDPAPLFLLQSEAVLMNPAVVSLLFTVKTYFEAASLLPEGDLNRASLSEALHRAMLAIGHGRPEEWREQERVAAVERALKDDLRKAQGFSHGALTMVGQSHIDLAWLWPGRESVRKVSRTFSTMSTLLDEFPDFTYAQSQPQAYAYAKEFYPELYERVKRHVASGRWELVGGMWVEPDLNLPSGESLVRQLIYGMKFYDEEFGRRPRIEWLPDTFGYCASLPQLLRKAGLDYFMTTKMNWNDTNEFPYDLFQWTGIDGTSVLSYVCHGINEYTHPKEMRAHWDHHMQRSGHPEQMLLYGHGDGGGGVTREMIEYASRSADLPGLPAGRFGKAHEFFDRVAAENPRLPQWRGDMYLELHRGTYTTHAFNKRSNRKAEVLYRDAEIWGVFAWNGDPSAAAQWEALERGRKKLLYNQFHDIIPGTSIPEAYAESRDDYEYIFENGTNIRDEALAALVGTIDSRGEGTPVVLFNSLSWDREDPVVLEGDRDWSRVGVYDEKGNRLSADAIPGEGGRSKLALQASVPQMGYRTVWLREEAAADAAARPKSTPFDGTWDTPFYLAAWNDRGELTRLYDKLADREVLAPGAVGNQWQLFHDRPLSWDAWDIDPAFERQPAELAVLVSAEVLHAGEVQDIIRMKWMLAGSTIEQDIVFYRRHRRIDFVTHVEWREDHKLLKVAFPVNVLSSKATYEIPFGAVERTTASNTSWDRAQFEVCGHRWADLSESGYGVALLNDCKYGYDVKGATMRLSLLRAPTWPDPSADRGSHDFTYALYPHEGDWATGEAVRRGFELNHPVAVRTAVASEGPSAPSRSFATIDARRAVLDTVKPAEDGDGIVLRFYESTGGREAVTVRFDPPAIPAGSASETNLLEEPVREIEIESGALRLAIAPYEVKTIRLKP
jgi:alpha-mannosidase